MAAQVQQETLDSAHDSVREKEIGVEQEHLDRVYRRLEEKIHEAEFLMNDAAQRGQVGTPGALAERDAQVFRAGIHLNRLNNEFEDFLFGRIDLLLGKDGKKGPDGAYTAVEPAEGTVRPDNTADIAETLHIGRIGVLDSDYAPLVIDWRAPAAAPFYRSTPVDPGRVVRRRVIRSKGRKVLGVEDDLMRPELKAFLDGGELPVIGDGALMAALGQARSHTMRDIVASIQAEQDLVIRAPAASVTYVEGGPGTGKTAVALHRAAYLLYQDRRRYAGGILIVSPTPLLVAYTEGVLPSLGEEGQVAIRAIGSLVDGAEATLYDSPAVARAKGSYRMLKVVRKAARGALESGDAPTRLRVVAFGRRIELEAPELDRIRHNALGGTAPVNLLRPRARKLLLDALWARSGAAGRHSDPELAAELRSSFDEDITSEDAFIAFLDAWWPELTPRGVLAAMADERRLGRWARRILNPSEVRRVARSLKRDGLSVHDVAVLDELQAALGLPARPRKKRDLDPLDQLTGLEELMPAREETQWERAERLAQERTEYAHVIVDEAQDLTPMQWRMVGRRGRHATWTVVGDPAQSSWSDPDEAAEARDEALGTRPRRRFTLTVNYRNPAEIAELAAKVLALAMPGSESPSAVRSTGVEPRFVTAVRESLARTVRAEAARLLDLVDGTVGVVVAMNRRDEAARWLAGLGDRVVALGSLEAKGLEYDATVVVSPAEIADESPAGLRVLYVALTRATQQLTLVSGERDDPDDKGVPDLLRD
ncbi:HelD family protein [Streptomyces europaeiscabiei]|uniref:UvrD-helicase domain-containing protein n=1 Tax=Streptomyces europaeiscabiei TaxID=146819 RepID=A0ABU4ND60_9ACTN|nr:UvrD-helicase domain-containing protein [Streptomyces europaeiscabiei]MDX2526608.1 UvrD-helicase domain-containing protein [Streptomyces europaeiscabiei]MDX2759311.1 UvrD-helicase domain-containing protein [Streptomyces europaeiscabiei]MDX2769836.1 UvrD-helicase domain-containing protein [Streptomyces europaeiscabiei]MDX3541634.1 UvrD-helicase domain-containing protein [Streptomyces europaeiscabiei]MDX3551975.1 UvrD-helicase domain-containing protein [Streptomyces europaeiscabiei]